MFSWSYVSTTVLSVLCFSCFAALWLSYREKGIETLRHFGMFFAWMGAFFLTMGAPLLFVKDFTAAQLGAFYIFGHIFLYIALAYYSRVPLSIVKPAWMRAVFFANLLAGAVITWVNIQYWNMPEIAANGVTLFHVTGPVGPMIGIVVVANLVLGGTALFGWLAWKQTGADRIKSVLLAVGLLLIAVAGPIHDNTSAVMMIAVADVLVFAGVAAMMAGIYYRRVFTHR